VLIVVGGLMIVTRERRLRRVGRLPR